MRDLLVARERTAQVRKQNARLREVMLSRDVIERAKGILVERYMVSDSQAFGLLQAESSRGHVRVRDVAIHLTLTGTLRRPEN